MPSSVLVMEDYLEHIIKKSYALSREKVEHCVDLMTILGRMDTARAGNSLYTKFGASYLINERFLKEACDSVENQLQYFDKQTDHSTKETCVCNIVRGYLATIERSLFNEPGPVVSGRLLATGKFLINCKEFHKTPCRLTIKDDPTHRCSWCSIDDGYEGEEDCPYFQMMPSTPRHPRGTMQLNLKHKTCYYLIETDRIYSVFKCRYDLDKSTYKQGGDEAFHQECKKRWDRFLQGNPSVCNGQKAQPGTEESLRLPSSSRLDLLLQTYPDRSAPKPCVRNSKNEAEPGPCVRAGVFPSDGDVPCEDTLFKLRAHDRRTRVARVLAWLDQSGVGAWLKAYDFDRGTTVYKDTKARMLNDNDALMSGIVERDLKVAANYVENFRVTYTDQNPFPTEYTTPF